jgi:hypothetical protein
MIQLLRYDIIKHTITEDNKVKRNEIPEYYLAMHCEPKTVEHLLVPFISRLLDYRFRINQFLLFHYINSNNKLGFLDFIDQVNVHLTYRFIDDKIFGFDHESGISEIEIEEMLDKIKTTINEFICLKKHEALSNLKLDSQRACELATKIFVSAKLIRRDQESFLKAAIMGNEKTTQKIEVDCTLAMLVSFFRILFEGTKDEITLKKFLEDNFQIDGTKLVHGSINNALNKNNGNFWPLMKLKGNLLQKANQNFDINSDLEELFPSA